MVELVHLVAQLQDDVVTKAEAAAMWQARAELLAIQLQQARSASLRWKKRRASRPPSEKSRQESRQTAYWSNRPEAIRPVAAWPRSG